MDLLRHFTFAAVSLLIVSSSALAHDSNHHGRPVAGKIASVNDQGFVLSTDDGPVQITVTGTTSYGKGEAKAERTDLRVGEEVLVYGTKLESGELVAKDVHLTEVFKGSGDNKVAERGQGAGQGHDGMPGQHLHDMQH